jgi:hypothetical protein
VFDGPPDKLRESPHPFVHELLATLELRDDSTGNESVNLR